MMTDNDTTADKNRGFLILETSGQFLTVVRRIRGTQAKILELASQYKKKLSQTRIDYQNYAQCFIQLAYLIYTAKYYGLNPKIQEDYLKVEESMTYTGQRKFSIIIYYTLTETPKETSNYSSIIIAIYNYLKEFHDIYEKNVKESPIDQEQKISIKNFFTQFASVLARVGLLDEAQTENYFYLLLQQTDLFRQSSMLLKIKNNSILDYIKMRVNNWKAYKEQDEKQVRDYNTERRKIKPSIQELKNREKNIQNHFVDFFQQLSASNPQKFKLKRGDSDNLGHKVKIVFTSYELPSESFFTRLNRYIPVQQSMIQPPASLPQKECFLQHHIEYHPQRNIMSTKLIPSSLSNSPQTIDYTMFQANVITFQSANISLQFVQDRTQKNSGKKYIGFRASSCSLLKEPIIEKVLLLMDLTMIVAKICQPQLLAMRKSFIVDQDTFKLVLLNQKLSHYTKVFLKCAKKVYSQ